MNRIRIERKGLRVEFNGSRGPTDLVIPLVLPPGKHRNVEVRVAPREDVALRNEVALGDALQTTFSSSHTTTGGASFFGTASHGRTFGLGRKAYEVLSLPDFRGIRFRLSEYEVPDDWIGLQLAFPITRCDLSSKEDYFARVTLAVEGKVVEQLTMGREVHPRAGRVLILSGYSRPFYERVFHQQLASPLANQRSPYLVFSDLFTFEMDNLRAIASRDYDGIHLFTNVHENTIHVNGEDICATQFFGELDGLGIKFVYIDTCSSVRVVSSFRAADLSALIAATENLDTEYAAAFESEFYRNLGEGEFASASFQRATEIEYTSHLRTRSGSYNPMFLDLKTDFCFGGE